MSLYVETEGVGPDLVMLHGWGMHGAVWHAVRTALAQQYRLHLVDLPGMGHSAGQSLTTLDALVDTVLPYIPHGAALCGWSMGGLVAMRVALDHPERLNHLVLTCSTPRFVNGEGWEHGVPLAHFQAFADQIAADFIPGMDRFLRLQAFGGESTRDEIRALRDRFAERPVPQMAVLANALNILLETDLRSRMNALALPVQLIYGARDTLIPEATAYWLAQHLPDARLALIPAAAHAPFISHPQAFITAIHDAFNHAA